MTRIRMSGALTIAVMTGAMLALPVAANAQGSCTWYGSTALKQQQKNEKLKCGFTGAQWHSDLGGHMAWCASVAPEVWKESAQERDKMLSECEAKR